MKKNVNTINSLTINRQLNQPFERGIFNVSANLSSPSIQDSGGYYSDEITSDVEADLYSQIHHEPVTEKIRTNPTNVNKSPKISEVQTTNISKTVTNIKSPKATQRSTGSESSKKLNKIKKSASKVSKSGNVWPVIGAVIPVSPSKAKTKSPVRKKPVTMTDSECEVITIKRPEDKIAPLVILSGNSSDEDNCESSVIIDEVIQLNITNESISRTKTATTPNKVVGKRKRKTKKDVSIKKKRKTETKEQSLNNSLRSMEDENLFPILGSSSDDDDDDNVIISETSSSPQQWKICQEDRYGSGFQSSRYYKTKSLLGRLQCHNCREFGHLAAKCRKAKKIANCFLCGCGGHSGNACKNPICSICLIAGHNSDYCHWKPEFLCLVCTICKVAGHLREECPDLWRRYHLTNENGAIVNSNSTRKVLAHRYCSNCGRNGHFGYECIERRVHNYVFPSDLHIVSYNEPGCDLPLTMVDNYASARDPQEEKICKGLFVHKHRLARLANQRFCEDYGVKPMFSPSKEDLEKTKWGGVTLGEFKLSVHEFLKAMRIKGTEEAQLSPIKENRRKRQKRLRKEIACENDAICNKMKKKKKQKVAKVTQRKIGTNFGKKQKGKKLKSSKIP